MNDKLSITPHYKHNSIIPVFIVESWYIYGQFM